MNLTPVFICGFFILGLYKIIELYARRRERIMLIEKIERLDSAAWDILRMNFSSGRDSAYWPLRIGALLVGLGAGILLSVMIFLNVAFNCSNIVERWLSTREYIYTCGPLLGAGLGLLVAFVIEYRLKNRKASAEK